MSAKLIMTTAELRLLRNAAEGIDVQRLAAEEGVTRKEVESKLKGIYKKLKAADPVVALQRLAQTDFMIIDGQNPDSKAG
jgi:DNA-binding CsgD family transcriptional regulator